VPPPRDLASLVRSAREAEDAGFDSVMISEHLVLGPSAGAHGVMANPREYALPGNQDPATPWPSSLVLLSAIAAVTDRVRLVAGAVIAPLRHPLLLARAVFADRYSEADLGQALSVIPPQVEAGFTTFCIGPSQFTDDPHAVARYAATSSAA
jgi:Luciferase-like monooxygenase